MELSFSFRTAGGEGSAAGGAGSSPDAVGWTDTDIPSSASNNDSIIGAALVAFVLLASVSSSSISHGLAFVLISLLE